MIYISKRRYIRNRRNDFLTAVCLIMHCKFILLFLLLGAFYSTSGKTNRSISTQLTDLSRDASEPLITILTPKQVRDAERAIEIFLSRFTGPVRNPIILRHTTLKSEDVQNTIGGVANAIRRKLMEFAKVCGLRRSVRQYKRTMVNSSDSENWLTEAILQGSLISSDLIRMWDETLSVADHYLRMRNVKLHIAQQKVSSPEDFDFLETLNGGSDHCLKLSKCFGQGNTQEISKELSRILVLGRSSPKLFIKLFRSQLDKGFQNVSNNSMQISKFFCRSLVNDSISYDKCCRTFARLNKCIYNDDKGGLRQNKVINKSTLSNAWIYKVVDISSCKIRHSKDGIVRAKCNDKKMPREANRQVKFIYETLLNRKLSKNSTLNRVARDFGNLLKKCPWARRNIEEICQFLWIYDEGNRRVKKLRNVAGRNAKITARYKKVVRSLAMYKSSLLKSTLISIAHMHRATTSLEKLLINGIKSVFNETWQGHINILSSMTDWMLNLLELVGLNGLSQDEIIGSSITTEMPILPANSMEDDASFDWESAEEYGQKATDEMHTMLTNTKKLSDVQRAADNSFNKFMRSLNRARVQKLSSRSTLAYLANNLLLVTMFMETLGFVSTLFYIGQNSQHEPTSTETSILYDRMQRSVEEESSRDEDAMNVYNITDELLNFNDVNWSFTQHDENDIAPAKKSEKVSKQTYTLFYNND